MKASQLIKALQEAIDKHGDLPCASNNLAGELDDVRSVETHPVWTGPGRELHIVVSTEE